MNTIGKYGVLRDKLRNDELEELDRLVILNLKAKLAAANNAMLNEFSVPYYRDCEKMQELMRPIRSSSLTPVVVAIDHERGGDMFIVCRIIERNSTNTANPASMNAALELMPIVRTYKNATRETLGGETCAIWDFLEEIEKAEYTAAVNALNLGPHITDLRDDNTRFEAAFVESDRKWEAANHGSIKPLRRQINKEFKDIAEALNLNVRVAQPPVKAILEEIIDGINSALNSFRRSLAHRGIHVPHGGDPGDYQKPDITNPPAPFE